MNPRIVKRRPRGAALSALFFIKAWIERNFTGSWTGPVFAAHTSDRAFVRILQKRLTVLHENPDRSNRQRRT